MACVASRSAFSMLSMPQFEGIQTPRILDPLLRVISTVLHRSLISPSALHRFPDKGTPIPA